MSDIDNKVTIENLLNSNDESEQSTTIDFNGLEIIVDHRLTFVGMLQFVDYISSICFDESNAYMPEMFVFGTKLALLTYYTNIDTNSGNVSGLYNLIYNTSIVDDILEEIDVEQFNEMVSAAKIKVNHVARANTDALVEEMRKTSEAFEALEKALNEAFDGVTADDIKGLFDAIADGQIDDMKLLESLVNGMTQNNSNIKNINNKIRN